jgi:CheY-like chemotaxis protein
MPLSMTQSGVLKFVIIDDDSINNFLVKRILKQLASNSAVESFTDPEVALDYLLALETDNFSDLVIFLDLNMPVLNGWDVLDKLTERFGGSLPSNAVLYIASSSDIQEDISRSKIYEMVTGYLTKPLKIDAVQRILDSRF